MSDTYAEVGVHITVEVSPDKLPRQLGIILPVTDRPDLFRGIHIVAPTLVAPRGTNCGLRGLGLSTGDLRFDLSYQDFEVLILLHWPGNAGKERNRNRAACHH